MIKVLIAIILAIILVHPVYALETSTPAAARKANLQNRVAAVKEKIATREAALKAKLENFKDKKKAEIAQRVNTNLNRINQNQTTQMLKHLEKMSGILDKLEARVNQATPDIKDPQAAKATIVLARSKIASSTAAVSDQAKKDYTLTVNSESKIKSDAQTVRNQLKNDLQTLRKTVIEAKQAVANSIRKAKSGKEATLSGQQ